MNNILPISDRVRQIPKSAIHEMTTLSKQVEDVAFLSWAKPTSDTPEHIQEAAIKAIKNGWVVGYSETPGLLSLREEIVNSVLLVDLGPGSSQYTNFPVHFVYIGLRFIHEGYQA